MKTIDNHLKSSSPKNDVFTYSFNGEEVRRINLALQISNAVFGMIDALKGVAK